MAYKTILVLCDASDAAATRLAFAYDLARKSGAHLIAQYVPPAFVSPMTLVASLDIAGHYRRHEEEARHAIEKTRAFFFDRIVDDSGTTSEWHASPWSPVQDALKLSMCSDLVVLGQEEADPTPPSLPRALPESLIICSGRPVMVVPLASRTPAKLQRAVICWDGGREAALATSQALPLLKAAEDVHVLMVHPGQNSVDDPLNADADPVPWLGRHGVTAKSQCRLLLSGDLGKEILCYALDVEADFIVMGGYGHSRLRQAVLGGTSRTVLEEMSVPVVMAH